MRPRDSRVFLCGIVLLAGITLERPVPGRVSAAACEVFPATGKQVCDSFLAYWRDHGGLAQQGYPLSDAFLETNPTDGKQYLTQYFERARFEHHPENQPPYDVLLGLLGGEQYRARTSAAPPPPFPGDPFNNPAYPQECATFAETGQTVCSLFLAYWRANGGLAQQGLPLTGVIHEANPTDGKTYPTQYFERARFEFHEEIPDPRYRVLLGLLGREQFLAAYPGGIPGGPAPSVRPTPTAHGFSTVPVGVPASMRWGVFATDRTLNIPAGFAIAVHARVEGARFLVVAPDGGLLVSQPGAGKVLHVGTGGGGDPVISELFADLRRPHDLVFHTAGGTTWLYVAESHRVSRAAYGADGRVGTLEPIITGLPDSSTSGLRGAYGHELKNLAISPGGALYLSIASACNACVEDTLADPVRGAIYRYGADGGDGRLYARGIRNAEGLAFAPDTGDLWAVVNNRDGLGDDFPAEPFIRVRDGADYGWPFCNADPAGGPDNPPYRPDPEHNADGRVDCAAMTPTDKAIQAHSAPLGLTFLHGTAMPAPWRDGVVAAYHGSWNRSRKTGFKFAWFPWVGGRPGDQVDLVSGWLDEGTQQAWGRPVDSAVDGTGAIFLSDDASGTIYRLVPTSTPPTAPPRTSP